MFAATRCVLGFYSKLWVVLDFLILFALPPQECFLCLIYIALAYVWTLHDVLLTILIAVVHVRMPPVLVLLVLWGGRLWISPPWGGWTRPSTCSPPVPGRALSGTSRPLLSALLMSWSMLPRAHPTGIPQRLYLACLAMSVVAECKHALMLITWFVLQLRHQEEGWDRACCQGEPLRWMCIWGSRDVGRERYLDSFLAYYRLNCLTSGM